MQLGALVRRLSQPKVVYTTEDLAAILNNTNVWPVEIYHQHRPSYKFYIAMGLYDDEISNTLKARYIEQPKRETTRLVDAWLTVFNVRYGSTTGYIRWRQLGQTLAYEINGEVAPDAIEDMLNIALRHEIPKIWGRMRGIDYSRTKFESRYTSAVLAPSR